jgi:large subunit ribosomal protein L21
MKTAVIQTGGKQYLIQEGNLVKVEKIAKKEGEKITFDKVLLTSIGKTTKVGDPLVKGAKVEAEITKQARHKKVIGVKMKSKKRNKKYFGHKQPYTEVKITKITTK